jgi:hypothetical protein
MATHYFVWYRVAGDPALARGVVNGLMQDIAKRTGVVGRLLMRPGSPPTWMEVYDKVADAAAFEAAYGEAVARAGVAEHMPAGRTVERFLDAL